MLSALNAPFIVAFGHKARSGKSECCTAIMEEFARSYHAGPYDIMRTGFAAPLRQEVWDAIYGENVLGECSPDDRVRDLCLMLGADYDPKPPIDSTYPYGKQRALLQKWGTEFRRAQDQFYWIKALEQMIIERKPQIVLIDDLRFPNEMFWVHSLGGTVIKVDRPDYHGDTSHVSERALEGYEFDHTLISHEGQVERLCDDAKALFDTAVKRWSGAECADLLQQMTSDLAVLQER